ncbi:FUSC family protein [Micromonospora sp. SH-82]|uniref:FUSC family protein n=1 Tax=Micromonospora sp. SH-82 TaxID=3132938 RepID=UPI003EBBE580
MPRWSWFREAAERVWRGWPQVLESTLAATVAWILATALVGHPQPFFAPAAALIVLGQARGQRTRRAVEVLIGVAAGVLVADVVIQALGARHTLTIFTVILLTIVGAVAVGATGVSVVQAAVSALYLVVIDPPGETLIPFRFVDALIGGAVALVVSQLAAVRHPLDPLVAEFRQTFADLSAVLHEAADALDDHDPVEAKAALERARGMDAAVERLRTGVLAAGEAVALHLRRRRHRGRLRVVDASIGQIDYAVRNARVLARAGVTLTRTPAPVPADLGAAVRLLAEAVHEAGEAIAADLEGRESVADECCARAETAALEAVRIAGRLFLPGHPLPLAMIIGQVRSTAIDLLRSVGPDDDAALLARIDEALGLPAV